MPVGRFGSQDATVPDGLTTFSLPRTRSRSLAEGEPGDCRPSGTVAGVRVGCFPDLYGALSGNPPDQVITCSCEAQGGLRARSSPLSDRLAGGHGGALDVGGLGAAEPCLGEPRARLDVAKVGGVG
jgi:hypothetical protein